MAGTLSHIPSVIFQKLLVDLGLAVNPPSEPWPCYIESEPDKPDETITVYTTDGRDQGRIQQGERQEMYGIQIRVRARDREVGWNKSMDLSAAIDLDIYDNDVTINGASYNIHSVIRTTAILPIGKEPGTKRDLFTINTLVHIRQN